MIHNFNFWIVIFLGAGYTIWRKIKNPLQFIWQEFFIQLFAGIIVTIAIFGTLFFWFSGISDTEIHNSYAVNTEYYEEWTEEVTYTEEECSGSGENKTCHTVTKTRHDYHPPSWQINTSTNEVIKIDETQYKNFVAKFRNEDKKFLYRINQVSFGDGNKYVTTWSGGEENKVPIATEHTYVNYLKASKSIKKRQGVKKAYDKLLKEYPKTYEGEYGNIEVDRIVNAGVNLPVNWVKSVDSKLDSYLSNAGARKELNILIYTVNSKDSGFIHALEEHWIYGKKNDVIIVMGINQFPKIEWLEIMVFAGNESLKVELRDSIKSLKDISNPEELTQIIKTKVEQKYKRVSMKTLEKLLYDIDLPIWVILLAMLCVATIIGFISIMSENNSKRDYSDILQKRSLRGKNGELLVH
ncbi:MAG: hypothetical protein PHG82_04825 [Candidatus Gracilibacteria bacterium]|nr:hypothetical protein [Candidatus Gracilibacteria bacterium]